MRETKISFEKNDEIFDEIHIATTPREKNNHGKSFFIFIYMCDDDVWCVSLLTFLYRCKKYIVYIWEGLCRYQYYHDG
jgi:hypothetical protein